MKKKKLLSAIAMSLVRPNGGGNQYSLATKLKVLLMCGAMFTGTSTQAALTVTEKTPKAQVPVTDGETIQYLYNVGTKSYFLGANDHLTRASVSQLEGYKIKISTKGTDLYTIMDFVPKSAYNEINDWKYVWVDNSPDAIWVDYNNQGEETKNFTISLASMDNTFTIGSAVVPDGFLGAFTTGEDTRLYIRGGGEANFSYTWISVNQDEYDKDIARKDLWDALVKADELGINVNEYEAVYADDNSTITQIKDATAKVKDEISNSIQPGTDYTEYIKNPEFSAGKDGWTFNAAAGGNVAADAAAKCAEAWNNADFDIYQEIENAPAGVYEVSVQGFYRRGRGDNAWNFYFDGATGTKKADSEIPEVPAYVYLNDAMTALPYVFDYPVNEADNYYTGGYYTDKYDRCFPDGMAAAGLAFDNGAYKVSAYGLVEKKGDPIRIGMKGNTSQEGDSWAIFTRFKLVYQGYKVEIIQPALEEAIKGIDLTKKMNSELEAEANALIASANEAIASGDGKTMFESLAKVYNIQSRIVESAAAYKALGDALDKYQERNAFETASTKFTYREGIEEGWNNGTLSTEEAASKAAGMLNEYRAYLRSIVGEYKNATAYVSNPNMSQAVGRTEVVEGWEYTTNASNHGTIEGESEDYTGNYFENWKSGGMSGDMKQTIKNLPSGKYFLRMAAFTRTSAAEDYVYIKTANGEKHGMLLMPEQPCISITDPIEVTDGTVEIGLHIGSNADWAALSGVELMVYSLDDEARTTEADKYGTICLPYNAEAKNATVYTASVDEANNVVNLTATDKIEAGKAYIYQAVSAAPSFIYIDDANLIATPASDGALIGVFENGKAVAGTYVMQTDDNGEQKFYKVAEGKEPNINAYRAYLTVSNTNNSKAFAIGIDTPTAVEAVKALVEGNAVIYDLNGVRLNSLKPGINIVNGVKVNVNKK